MGPSLGTEKCGGGGAGGLSPEDWKALCMESSEPRFTVQLAGNEAVWVMRRARRQQGGNGDGR